MEIKTHKKDGVALVLILIIVTSVSLTVMASIKVMTKSHTKYTTGKSQDGAINTSKATGKFICYKDATGQLHRVLIKYRANGTIDNSENVDANGNRKTEVSECEFPVDNSVQSYKITLLGGGGGGAVPYGASDFGRTIPTSGDDSIIVGENQTVFKKLFVNQSKYIDEDSANSLIYNTFFADMKVKIKAPDAVKKDSVYGAAGAACTQNIFGSEDAFLNSASSIIEHENLYERTIYYGYEKAEKYPYEYAANNNAYFQFKNKKITAYGGLSALNNASYSPTKCTESAYRSLTPCTTLKNVLPYYERYTESGVGKCILDPDTTISDRDPSKTYTYKGTENATSPISYATSVNNPIFNFVITFKGVAHEIGQNSSIRFALKENKVDIYEANAGEPGEKVEFETKYLTNDPQTKTLTISGSNIGNGGAGGTTASKNGSSGTQTKLELDTRGGHYSLVAKGGQGGKTSYARTLESGAGTSGQNNIGHIQLFAGKNGSQSSYQFSGDFGINNLTPGITKSEPTATITKASLPGSSGASGMLKWNGVHESAAIPWLEFISNSGTGIPLSNTSILGEVTTYYTETEVGGAGAYGAIIIEW